MILPQVKHEGRAKRFPGQVKFEVGLTKNGFWGWRKERPF